MAKACRAASSCLVDRGVVHEVAYCRQAAHTAGVQPTGHGFPLPNEYGEAPMNIVIAGGATPLEDMIASTARGILVTRLWYIREVDPYEKIMTGMTRDGTFLIEDGRIARGVRNFRFNQACRSCYRTSKHCPHRCAPPAKKPSTWSYPP
jgi:predicted Zn-dependent protease